MSKFNTNKTTNNATTYEGGKGYEKSLLDDWLNFLFSSFLSDQYYESAEEQQERFIELTRQMVSKYGIQFVMKATIFARKTIGMRSVSQLSAAVINGYSGDNKRKFFREFCNRVDDVSEVFAAVEMLGEKRSHAMVRGFGDYLSEVNEHQLSKYRSALENKKYNLFDIINLTHAHSDAIEAYKNGNLKLADTWENSISNCDDKGAEWKRLVEKRSLGYIALIRNLDNILSSVDVCPKWIDEVLMPQIANEYAIERSLVMPYQIYSAYKKVGNSNMSVAAALDKAFGHSVCNMPYLKGKSCIILDVSGSMYSPISDRSHIDIVEVCAVYATAIFMVNPKDTDIIKFGTEAMQVDTAEFRNKSAFSIIDILVDRSRNDKLGCGTVISKAFEIVDRKYDRMILFSDQQVCDRCVSLSSWHRFFGQECLNIQDLYDKFGRFPVYSFDLGNYPSSCVPNDKNVHYITALSDDVFKFIELSEMGENNLVEYINFMTPGI